jgi:membrane associated rhomboid family serine protease
MGIYDRDYYRDDREGFRFHGPRTVVTALLLVNFAVWLVGQLFFPNPKPGADLDRLSQAMAATVGSLTDWRYLWQFLTYGFAHALAPQHIILNMLTLWMFGRDIESKYGPKEFLRLYLFLAVGAGLIWALINRLHETPPFESVVGASGAVVGVVMLYALNFPHRTVLLFFVIPAPAWVMGALLIFANVGLALGQPVAGANSGQIAWGVHLAGVALAFLYYRFNWNLGRLVPRGFSLDWLKPRSSLRVHDPEQEEPPEVDLGAEVDRILEKIHREGEARLTRKERRTLVDASREYQRKRQDGPRQ